MRWENLTVNVDEQARLPGYRESAVVRRFQAPQAMDTRFYEVRARSALNRVPRASRMPFKWTINPYRGCTHACVYCLAADTAILMADGHTKPLALLRPGDRVYGTIREGRARQLVKTDVLDHWSSIKPAFRVTLEDGTELISSGDHRFLAEQGWKHVTDLAGPAPRRAHLSTNDRLLGLRIRMAAEHGRDYRRGYLCAIFRMQGQGADEERQFGGHGTATVHRLPPPPPAQRALSRSALYLALEHPAAVVDVPSGSQLAIGRTDLDDIRDILAWPLDPSEQWRTGFLAAIFDAQDPCDGQRWWVSNTEPLIGAWLGACLAHFGFHHQFEDTDPQSNLRTVRLLGDASERLRFMQLVDQHDMRIIDGMALNVQDSRRVAAIEPLGLAMRLYDITTGTGDFIANGVVSHNCFARPTHRYLDFNAGRDFEREIVVKVNAPELLRAELARTSWRGEHVALGTNTDPYQWVEGRYRLMEGIWEALRDARNPCSILTKSPLLLRDLGVLREIAAVTDVSACLSVPTLDEKAWRTTEPHTPHPRARLEAVGELNRAGIPCGILVAPLMPGINDAPSQVEPILELAAANGATGAGGIALHLRAGVRQVFMDWLRSQRPDLVGRYEELYGHGAYAPKAERERIDGVLRAARRKHPPHGSRAGAFRRNARSPALDRTPESVFGHPSTSTQQTLF